MLVDYERGEGRQRHWHERLRIVRRTEFVDLQALFLVVKNTPFERSATSVDPARAVARGLAWTADAKPVGVNFAAASRS
jgi:hypothetical protein